MHKFMRAIGFSEFSDRKRLKELLTDVIMNSDNRGYTMNQENIMLGEFTKISLTVWESRFVVNLMMTTNLFTITITPIFPEKELHHMRIFP